MTEKRLGGITGSLLLSLLICSSSLSAATHKVKPGDTLWDLAKKNHTTPKAIAKANHISENATLALGKGLVIPGKCSAISKRHSRKAAAQKRWARNHKAANVRKAVAKTPSAACGSQNSASSNDSTLVQTALRYRGARYHRGGTSRGGFDCSGFTRYVFAKYGIRLPHSSSAQARLGTRVSRGELKQGDLVFFHTYRRGVSHVGIYIGKGSFVHAATYGRGVRVDALSSAYYSRRYVGARRVR